MKHSFLDKYSDLDSFIHRLDPRTKIIFFFIFILFIIFTPATSYYQFLSYLLILATIIFLSKLPLVFVLERLVTAIPFVILISIFIPFFKGKEGILIFWNILTKSCLAILCMVVLSSTTKFANLLKGFELLGIPKIMLFLLSFMYRYLFLFVDETEKIERGYQSRATHLSVSKWKHMKILTNVIGILFIRAYERGERVYQAMLARGFRGEIKTLNSLKITLYDFCFSIFFLSTLVLIKILF